MIKFVKLSLAVSMLAVSFAANAMATRKGQKYDDGAPTHLLVAQRGGLNSEVELGRWHSNLDAAKAYAEEHGVPLVAVWSNGDDCGHCKKWENCALSDVFEEWMPESGIVYYFGYNKDSDKGATLGEWCYWCGRDNPYGKTLPLVRLYWKKDGKVIVDRNADGDTVDGNYGRCTLTSTTLRPDQPFYVPGDYDTYNPGGRYMIKYLKDAFPGYVPKKITKYAGGEFISVNNEKVGFQVERDTSITNIVVPMFRSAPNAIAIPATNYVVSTYPSGKVKTNAVYWAKNQDKADFNLKIATAWLEQKGDAAADKIDIKLYTEEMTEVEGAKEICVRIVEPVGNSPKNPCWIGEKTVDSLRFGKWTMDLDVATNKVSAFNATRSSDDKAYALVLVSGSMWCPDCVRADHFLLTATNTSGEVIFRKWAQERNLALCVVDIPKYKNDGTITGTSLLSYDFYQTSDDYVTGRGAWNADEAERWQSGTQYLSRHGAKTEDIEKVLNRNKRLVSLSTLEGGWRRPEQTSNKYRTGVPIFILLRGDGSIVGRWDAFASDSPSGYSENYFKRIEELIALDNDAAEESNDNWRTTNEEILKRGKVTNHSLSHVDISDAYRIEESAKGQTVDFRIVGTADEEVEISIFSSANEKLPLAITNGLLSAGLSVSAKITGTNCYFAVRDSGRSDADSEKSSVYDYTINSSNVLQPQEEVNTEVVSDGNPEVTISVVKGSTYRLTNVDEASIDGVFSKGSDLKNPLYIAKVDGPVVIRLKDKTDDGYKMDYQVWNTGKIGFARVADSVSEPTSAEAVTYTFEIKRTGGVAGKAKVRIGLDVENSCQITDGSVFEWTEEGRIYAWEDGSNETQTVSVTIKPNIYSDGNQHLIFTLAAEGSDAGVDPVYSTFILTIKDTDAPTAGVLAISECMPMSSQMKMVASGGAEVQIAVSRETGADGVVSAALLTTAGCFENGKKEYPLYWASRSNEVKRVKFTVPEYVQGGLNRYQVTLVSKSSARVDYARKYLTVQVVDSTVGFVATDETRSERAIRYIPIEPIELTLDGEADKLDVVKYSGSLAPGLEWNLDRSLGKVVVSGTPSHAGTWTIVFQAIGDGDCGRTAALTVKVSELAIPDESESDAEPINAAVAVPRTFKEALVLNEAPGQTNMIGLLTVTIPQTGRVSAKMRMVDGTVSSYISDGWDSINVEDGTLITRAAAVVGGENISGFKIAAFRDGRVTIDEFKDAGNSLSNYSCVMPGAWSSKKSASAWKGYYTVSLAPSEELGALQSKIAPGSGFVTLRMTTAQTVNAGKMVYSGVLPNGKAFSGFGTLSPMSWNQELGEYDYAALPVLAASYDEVFAGAFKVLPKASSLVCRTVFSYDGMPFIWEHKSICEDMCSVAYLDAFGSFYDYEANIEEACSETFNDQIENLRFFVQTDLLNSQTNIVSGMDLFSDGLALGWNDSPDIVGVRVWHGSGKNKMRLRDEAKAKAENGLTFTFNRMTGVVNGAFKIGFESGNTRMVRYRGIVMPRWGASCGVCSLGGDLTLRPFVSGPAWFEDEHIHEDGKGRVKVVREQRGLSFSVGVESGK